MHLIIGKIDMGQKITIRINSKKYELSAKTPDDEEIYRNAAKLVESTLSKYSNRFPEKDTSELLTFVALNECIARLSARRMVESLENEVKALEKQTNTYLDGIKD